MPETKRLTLDEMDINFGSEDTAQADRERINAEIGLTQVLWEGLKGQGVRWVGWKRRRLASILRMLSMIFSDFAMFLSAY